jgi:hypothetical protein
LIGVVAAPAVMTRVASAQDQDTQYAVCERQHAGFGDPNRHHRAEFALGHDIAIAIHDGVRSPMTEEDWVYNTTPGITRVTVPCLS